MKRRPLSFYGTKFNEHEMIKILSHEAGIQINIRQSQILHNFGLIKKCFGFFSAISSFADRKHNLCRSCV